MSAVNSIYTGASDFGRFTAIISAVFATIIGLLAIGIGIYLIYEDSVRTLQIQGTVMTVTCPTGSTGSTGSTGMTGSTGTNNSSSRLKGHPSSDCLIDVNYSVQNRSFTKKFAVSPQTSLQPGDMVTLFVDPNNPQDNVALGTNNNSETVAGGILIGVGAFIILISWLFVYLTYKYKFFASIEGFATGANIIYNAV